MNITEYLPNVDQSRVGDWIQTYTGGSFWPLDPRPEEVSIVDIAHALSMRCRYAGHCTRFYSVAEHCVLVSKHVAPEHAMWGLLHDAAEAYSADIPRPLKPALVGWKKMEAKIMAAVCERFRLPPDEPEDVTRVDWAITSDERAALMAPSQRDWGALPPPVGAQVFGLDPTTAELMFIRRFRELSAV